MMPLAPHLSLPAIGHLTATAAADHMTMNSSKPKLAFSIDSIVGRNNSTRISSDINRSDECRPEEDHRLSPSVQTKLSANHKNRHLPYSCVRRSSSPPMISRLNQMSPQLTQQLSPSNRSATNVSPLSTPSPILSVANGSQSSPYNMVDSRSPHMQSIHSQPQQSHSTHHSPIVQPSPLSHPLMMAAAHHMSPIPQHQYHQAMALYPWLLRANPWAANRFHGMPFDGSLSSFLLPPFRKPKRIRTAFSPGQLLKLEQAFEKNHYVVGNERKQLASNLGLSETQVKVWFQNRRTKHKRQKQEDEEEQTGGGSGGGAGSSSGDNKLKNNCAKDCGDSDDEDMDEEEVDIDLEENEDNEESDNELLMNSNLRHHHLWYQSLQSATDMSSAHSTQLPLKAPNHSIPSTSSSSSSSLKI